LNGSQQPPVSDKDNACSTKVAKEEAEKQTEADEALLTAFVPHADEGAQSSINSRNRIFEWATGLVGALLAVSFFTPLENPWLGWAITLVSLLFVLSLFALAVRSQSSFRSRSLVFAHLFRYKFQHSLGAIPLALEHTKAIVVDIGIAGARVETRRSLAFNVLRLGFWFPIAASLLAFDYFTVKLVSTAWYPQYQLQWAALIVAVFVVCLLGCGLIASLLLSDRAFLEATNLKSPKCQLCNSQDPNGTLRAESDRLKDAHSKRWLRRHMLLIETLCYLKKSDTDQRV
jgi:hypothetical protein